MHLLNVNTSDFIIKRILNEMNRDALHLTIMLAHGSHIVDGN